MIHLFISIVFFNYSNCYYNQSNYSPKHVLLVSADTFTSQWQWLPKSLRNLFTGDDMLSWSGMFLGTEEGWNDFISCNMDLCWEGGKMAQRRAHMKIPSEVGWFRPDRKVVKHYLYIIQMCSYWTLFACYTNVQYPGPMHRGSGFVMVTGHW